MQDAVAEVRAFNRFYTQWVGALDRHHLGTRFSLTEVRVLYEIASEPGAIARDIADRLGLDVGYLSRILKRFEADGLVRRSPSRSDRRTIALSLTASGLELFRELDALAAARMGGALERLDAQQRIRVASAMGIIRSLLDAPSPEPPSGVTLRGPRAGDYGWAIERHGVLYDAEYGWGAPFEGLVAELFGRFARSHDPARERCWIAELNRERAGCVFVAQRSVEVAQLRCLLVEPAARGHGIGGALVDACIGFARDAGYRRMMLWTNKGLDSARKIYEAAGFRLVEEQVHREFGPELVGQNWEMAL